MCRDSREAPSEQAVLVPQTLTELGIELGMKTGPGARKVSS
jgi:hypothetical protein